MPLALSQLLATKGAPILGDDNELFDRHYELESLYEDELEKNGVKNFSLTVSTSAQS